MIAYVCVDPGIPVFGTKGASVHIQEIVRAWRKLGHEVHIYCTRLGEDRPSDLADVPVTHVPVGKGQGATSVERAADRERVVARAAQRIADLVIQSGASAIYERYALFSTVLARAVDRLGIPGFLEVNAPLIEEQHRHRVLVAETLARDSLKAQLAAATTVAAVSADVAQWCLTNGDEGLAERVVVAPNGVNVERILPVEQGLEPMVLFIGTLKPWHGTEDLIRAAALSRQSWRLRVVGDGPEGPRLRSLAAELKVSAEFTGALTPSQIPAAMSGAWVAVAPYPQQPDQYFSPLKIFEYSAAALPVVASRVGQIPEIVEDGRTGILVSPSNPVELAEAIDALIAEPKRAKTLGQAGRKLMSEKHTWVEVLRQIVGDHDF